MKYNHPITPSDNNSDSIKLIKSKIHSKHELVYIDVKPELHTEVDNCFKIVEDHVAIHGGSRKIGWAIWELPGLYIEAEFHAVWGTPEGRLLDITPKHEPTKSILFLQDDLTPYKNHQVDNIRVVIRKEEALLKLFIACEGIFEILNRDERKFDHGQISLSGAEAAEHAYFEKMKIESSFELMKIKPSIGPYLPCPCGSGKKVKWCCGMKTFSH